MTRTAKWYEDFNRFAGDLYPGRYSWDYCRYLEDLARQIEELAEKKQSTIVAHNYLYPELQEISARVDDSLRLSLFIRDQRASRVDFQSVFFMGATAKIITGDATRVFVPDYPDVIGCSLVFGTDYDWIETWKREHPDGILITYINSDAYTKSISDYIATSHNLGKVIVHVAQHHPGQKMLVLPDKFLGYVMKNWAVAQGVSPDLIEIYEFRKGHHNAACYVHDELIPSDSVDIALWEHPEADLMIHPECGCAASCLLKIQKHEIPDTKAYFLSTGGMLKHALESSAKQFLVATEKGMLYRLRKSLPAKEFIPVSDKAVCRYMKACTLEKLLVSLQQDRIEIVLCDDCCDPKKPFQVDNVVHIQRSVAAKAMRPIQRMLSIV